MKLKSKRCYLLKNEKKLIQILDINKETYDTKEYRDFIIPLSGKAVICELVHCSGTCMDIKDGGYNIHINFIQKELYKDDYPEYFL